jgi:predicted deacylase
MSIHSASAMSHGIAFSPTYALAQSRFLAAARTLGCRLESYALDLKGPEGESLAIDVAMLGDLSAQKIIVISSGLHGIEGFLGSAVQCRLLEAHLKNWKPSTGQAFIFLHALNPYGMAWRRRWNEDNVDLNRNFLLPGELYAGSPQKYQDLNTFLNPTSPPSRFELFLPKAAFQILRYGMKTLKDTLPVGQYDFPKGLFFGGKGPTKTHQILALHFPRWLEAATEVVHLDLHTGLGPRATYKLLIEEPEDSEQALWLAAHFGADVVEAVDTGKTAYRPRGSWAQWCKTKFPQSTYRFLTAEFGTYSNIQIMKALRAENRAYFWEAPDESSEWARECVEMFIPAAADWRESAVSKGLNVVQQAMDACFRS